ncbi:FAD-binding protein [Paenibacillaceae bacterium WGS1546]|uniref:FAD-binding protein n=1 Tax=Cohnella sp. WGS1546 TaxID=3366810 RepID=UPI00372D6681
MENNRNWAGNYEYRAAETFVPDNKAQIQEWIVRRERVKVLGTRHSFNAIADTEGSHLSLRKLNRVANLDAKRNLVTVEAGIRYGELCGFLHERGYALANLASLPHISVAGACATGTHGSGDRNRTLSASVQALEIVQANGEILKLTRDRDARFAGAVVGLGALGVVTELTLDIVPAFRIGQRVYENLPLAKLADHLDEIFSCAYSVSLFTDWKSSAFNQVWVKRKVEDPLPESFDADLHGAARATANVHPVPGHSAESCSEQLDVPGPWHERLPHFRMDFVPSAGDELQSEYFVRRRDAYSALRAIDEIRETISPLLHVSEIRTVAEDDLWLSPCCGRDSVGIHFTWRADEEAVRRTLPIIERQLAPYEARPHWSKLFAMSVERLEALYEKMPEFRELILEYDPDGKFHNGFLDRAVLRRD